MGILSQTRFTAIRAEQLFRPTQYVFLLTKLLFELVAIM